MIHIWAAAWSQAKNRISIRRVGTRLKILGMGPIYIKHKAGIPVRTIELTMTKSGNFMEAQAQARAPGIALARLDSILERSTVAGCPMTIARSIWGTKTRLLTSKGPRTWSARR